MKRTTCILVLLLLVMSVLPMGTFAAEETCITEDVIYFNDGSYITIEIVEDYGRTTARKTKNYVYRDSDGEEQWRASLIGTFTYNGTTATCTDSSCDVTITNTAWSATSKTVGKSGASATAQLTMTKKLLGFITTQEETLNMSLTCSPTGVFS